MNILLVTHAVFLDRSRICTGNSVRAYFLCKGLVAAGHQVTFVYPAKLERFVGDRADEPEAGVRAVSFTDYDDFQRVLKQVNPDCVLVGYWESLDLLPGDISVPVIVDVVAPRVLEAMFEPGRPLDHDIRRMLDTYRKVDRFIVGTERQSHFLLPWLIMAGFDCRYNVPIDIVPISSCADEQSTLPRETGMTRFVSGGVSWPWRRTEDWFDALVETLQQAPAGTAKLSLFSGGYIYFGRGDGTAEKPDEADQNAVVEPHGLLSYGDMQEFLATRCHVGVELADRNVEREYSQSFRAMEFLTAGLPLICNDYLEIADLVREYDAGWIVSDLSEVPALVTGILGDQDTVQRKSRNARRLVNERFHYLQTIRPVLKFLEAPDKPGRGPALMVPVAAAAQMVAAAPPPAAPSFLSRQVTRLKRAAAPAARRFFRWMRTGKGEGDIVIVTRSDIFPTHHGAAVKIDRTAAALSELGRTVYLVTNDRRRYYVYRNGASTEAAFPSWVSMLAPPRRWVRKKTLASGIPFGDAFLYYALFDWSYIVRTVYLAMRHPISVFQAEFPAYARACVWGRRLFGGKVVLVEHNVEYQRLHDQTQGLSANTFNFLKTGEIHLCNLSDLVIAVSERDREKLVSDGVDARRVHYVPHGVDIAAFDAAAPLDVRSRHNIDTDETILIYHGTYQYPPNLESMQAMATRILPRLKARGLKVKVLALGNMPPKEPLHEDIIFTGIVPEVAPYLLAADIAVVPLLKGGGTRMKILDYFAARLPVVSTRKGIEGIPAEDGVEALIVDGADESFARAVAELIADRDKARKIGDNGRKYVNQIDWKEIAQRYVDLIESR